MTSGNYLLSAKYIQHMLNYLTLAGDDVESILVEYNLVANDLNSSIEADKYLDVISAIITKNKRFSFGLHFGNQLSVMAHGNLSYALLSCGSLLQAIDLITNYIHLLTPFIHLSNEVNGDNLVLTVDTIVPLKLVRVPCIEIFVTALNSIFRVLSNKSVVLSHACFSYPRPKYAGTYIDFLDCPVSFDTDRTQLIFKLVTLKTINPYADKTVFELSHSKCSNELISMDKHYFFEDRVYSIIVDSKTGFKNLEQVASELAMSPRSLRRRLNERNTCFKYLLNKVKFRISKELLTSSSMTVQEIGYKLGYTESSNFARAFKKWSGTPPSSYIKIKS